MKTGAFVPVCVAAALAAVQFRSAAQSRTAPDVIDLRGRTVIPGLIDNPMHLLRAGETWQRAAR